MIKSASQSSFTNLIFSLASSNLAYKSAILADASLTAPYDTALVSPPSAAPPSAGYYYAPSNGLPEINTAKSASVGTLQSGVSPGCYF